MSKINYSLLAILILTFLISGQFSVVQAQEATSASKTTQNLRERIERIVEEKKDQIKGIISNLDATKQGFIGQVQRISEEAITVKTNKAIRILPITSEVQLIKGTTAIKLTDIAVDDWLVVMGILEDDTFRPIRILVSSEDIRPKTYLVTLGSIASQDRTSLTIAPRNNPETMTVITNTKTIYEDIKGNQIKRAELEDDTQALIIAYDEGGQKIARRVRILTVLGNE